MLFILKGRLLVLRETENNTKFYDNLWERKFGNVNIVNLHARTNFAPHRNLTPQKIPHIEEQLISDGSYWGTMGLQDTKPLSYTLLLSTTQVIQPILNTHLTAPVTMILYKALLEFSEM